MNSLKKHRILACVLCVVFVAVLFVSESYIAAYARHDCIGEDCPVCAMLNSCEQLMKRFAANGAIAAFMGVCALLFGCVRLLRRVKANSAHTLVALKVKLSN